MDGALLQQMVQKHHAKYIGFSAPITDEQGRLRADCTHEGIRINDNGYARPWPVVKQAILDDWNDL